MNKWVDKGLFAPQTAQRVTAICMNMSGDRDSFRANKQSLGLMLVCWLISCTKLSSSSAQIHMAIVQSTKVWRQESGAPQIMHAAESDICLCSSTSAVGIELLASLYRKNLILGDSLAFQRVDQALISRSDPKDPATSSIQLSIVSLVFNIIRYADLTEKPSLFSLLHAQKSLMFLVHNGILKMASASIGRKTARTSGSFHVAVAGMMS